MSHSILCHAPVRLELSNLKVMVPGTKKVLLSIDEKTVIPGGKITAVMGQSGAGKSTLLSYLANRHADTLRKNELKQYVNNKEVKEPFPIGFVSQEDVFMENLSVRENLLYAAKLKLSHSHYEFAEEVVDYFIKELDLEKKQHDPAHTASGGQKRRLTAGMELVALPRVLFLDEPTSGLDATSASEFIECLTRVAKRGVTIAIVIHQPRFEIYKQFDHFIVLLKAGDGRGHGELLFSDSYERCRRAFTFDPHTHRPVYNERYLEDAYELTEAQLSHEHRNPADWILDSLNPHDATSAAAADNSSWTEKRTRARANVPSSLLTSASDLSPHPSPALMTNASSSSYGATAVAVHGESPPPSVGAINVSARKSGYDELLGDRTYLDDGDDDDDDDDEEGPLLDGDSESALNLVTLSPEKKKHFHRLRRWREWKRDKSKKPAIRRREYLCDFLCCSSLFTIMVVPLFRMMKCFTCAQEQWTGYVPEGILLTDDDPIRPRLRTNIGGVIRLLFRQFWVFFCRALQQQIRHVTPFIIYVLLGLSVGVITGFVYNAWDVQILNTQGIVPEDLNNPVPMAASFALGVGAIGALSALGTFGDERVVHEHEVKCGMNFVAYFVAKVLADIPRIIVLTLVMVAPYYPLTRYNCFSIPHFLEYFGFALIVTVNGTAIGYVTSLLTDPVASPVLAIFVVYLTTTFSGASPTLPEYEPWLKWVTNLSYVRWVLEAEVSIDESFIADPFSPDKSGFCQRLPDIILEGQFGYSQDNLVRCILVSILIAAVVYFIAMIMLSPSLHGLIKWIHVHIILQIFNFARRVARFFGELSSCKGFVWYFCCCFHDRCPVFMHYSDDELYEERPGGGVAVGGGRSYQQV